LALSSAAPVALSAYVDRALASRRRLELVCDIVRYPAEMKSLATSS